MRFAVLFSVWSGPALAIFAGCATEVPQQHEVCAAAAEGVSMRYPCKLGAPATHSSDTVLISLHRGEPTLQDVRELIIERHPSTLGPEQWATAQLGSLIQGAPAEPTTLSGQAAIRYTMNGSGVYEHSTSWHYVAARNDTLFYILATVSHPSEAIKEQYTVEMQSILDSIAIPPAEVQP